MELVELNAIEQAVLNAACIRIAIATQEAEASRRAAELAARKAEALAHEARGVLRSLMELSGRNPEGYQIEWNGERAAVTEKGPTQPELRVVEAGNP